MDSSDFSVYGEAKGEYTRQLCVFLVPSLESYFLDMMETAKGEAPNPSKVLWQFQTMLQAIPDWNQDKVLRETEKIQEDCKCDYLEELLTAVFIAHTKVLSAIRLTTKQKKLQITIPKLDHFLHRVLSDSARQLWTNVFLFADTNSIEKQKNLRQVAELLRESILQAIRGMLPVKNILREYLHEDAEAEASVVEETTLAEASVAEETTSAEENKEEEDTTVIEKQDEESDSVVGKNKEESTILLEKQEESIDEQLKQEEKKEEATPVTPNAQTGPPIIHIDSKSNVSFQQGHTFFSSDNLNANAIEDVPFSEAELKIDDDEEDEEDEEEFEEIDSLQITDEVIPFEAEEFT